MACRSILVGLAPSQRGVSREPLRAVIFDLDALADVECAGHRLAFNAAFAALGLNFEWSVTRYRQAARARATNDSGSPPNCASAA